MPTETCDGTKLYYEADGEGRPIVFLHGAWAGLRYFDAQLDGLSDAYRAVGVDFRGHGRSEKTADGHVVPQYARDVRAFLDRLELDDVVLVGWSLGALVAWEYVDRFGTDRLRGIHEDLQTDHLAAIERVIDATFKRPPEGDLRATLFDEDAHSPPLVKSAIVVDATAREYRDVLRTLDVPMLACAGADETWRTVAVVEATAELAPDARFELFEESGHCPTVEEPDRFNRVVRDFVDSL